MQTPSSKSHRMQSTEVPGFGGRNFRLQWFSEWPERQVRIVRWILLIGWLLLILSLLLPSLQLAPPFAPQCPDNLVNCSLHQQPGNRLFWGVVVPTGVLIIVALSHELWRRICPLAFVSQPRERSTPAAGTGSTP